MGALVERFEFVQGTSSKFWQYSDGNGGTPDEPNFIVEHGRIGATPVYGGILNRKQISAKVREKLRKGYVKVN